MYRVVRRPAILARVLSLLAALLGIAAALPLTAGAQNTGTIRGTLADSSGMPVAQASVIVDGAGLRATSDAAGTYNLPGVPAGTWTVHVRRVGYTAAPRRATVTSGETVRLDFVLASVAAGLAPVEVVVGSRARHIAADELAVPVDIISLAEIREQGTTETAQVLQQVAPSVSFPRQSVSDASEIVRPFTMRGLNPDHTLVLVNGRRRHHTALIHYFGAGMLAGSSGVDLNAFPVSAIERIEVLRDGAAAQYGSDAIAGVVNLVLREGRFSPTITADFGQYAPTDWPSDGRTIDVSGGWGIPVGRGSIGLFAEWRDREETNRAGADLEDQVVPGDADDVEDGEVVNKNNPVPQPNHHWGDGAEQALMTFANARYPLGATGSSAVYAFGGYSDRRGTGYGYYRQALSERNWPQIYPLGFLPTFHPDILDASGSAGLRGAAGSWFYDVGVTGGYNRFDFRLENTLNTSLGPCFDTPCAPGPDGVLGNADDPGIPNKTSMDAGTLRYGEAILNLDVSREFFVPRLSSPLNVAFGVAVRRETFEIVAGEPASWIQGFHPTQYGDIAPSGSQVFPGFRPSDATDESRDNTSVYLDLEGDILPRVLANVAARLENYSDFGAQLTGKLALRVQPTTRLTLRSAVSTGFRAPSLNQSFYSSTATTFVPGPGGEAVPTEFGIFPVASDEARVLGARELREETSTNVSAGFAVSPTEAITFTADYYWIALDDRIALTTFLGGAEVEALLASVGSDATAAQYFTNAIDTRTHGVDVTANWLLDVGPGTLDLTGVYNYTRNRVHGGIFAPPELAGSGVVLLDRFGEGGILALERERPRWRSTLSSSYRTGPWRGLVRASLYGPYSSALYGYTAESVQDYGSQTIWDAEAGRNLGEMLNISIGARNIFDTFPPRMTLDNSFGLFLYPSASPYGFNGRFLYTRMEARLGR